MNDKELLLKELKVIKDSTNTIIDNLNHRKGRMTRIEYFLLKNKEDTIKEADEHYNIWNAVNMAYNRYQEAKFWIEEIEKIKDNE